MQCNFHGKRVLIVEDNFLAADEIAYALEAANAVVLGPCANLEEAEAQVMQSELAILDVDIRGRTSFALADRLQQLEVPFIFFSGYDRGLMPERFAHVGYVSKPTSPVVAIRKLDASAREIETPTVAELVPTLRARARDLLSDPLAADRLVERTLQLAIDAPMPLPSGARLLPWLMALLHEALRDGSASFLN